MSHKQGRRPDKDRVLLALVESDGLSNSYLRTELDLGDSRYKEIIQSLLGDGIVEKYRCRGGGVRLTKSGEKSVQAPEDRRLSSVKAEKDLYEPLVQYLEDQAEEDEIDSIPINTANLRSKGKWQNPDLTQVSIETYLYLKKVDVIITTYEVKQWGRWDVNVVFEAASHRRFSNESIVVLEWPNDLEVSLSDTTYRMNEISRECRRFGVGLYTMQKYYQSYRLHSHLAPERHDPSDADVEAWLEYMFERLPKSKNKYLKALSAAEVSLKEMIHTNQ